MLLGYCCPGRTTIDNDAQATNLTRASAEELLERLQHTQRLRPILRLWSLHPPHKTRRTTVMAISDNSESNAQRSCRLMPNTGVVLASCSQHIYSTKVGTLPAATRAPFGHQRDAFGLVVGKLQIKHRTFATFSNTRTKHVV